METGREFVHGMIAKAEAADLEDADAFVIVTVDTSNGTIFVNGPFDSPVDAMAYAEKSEVRDNEGLEPDEPRFVARVYPMMGVD